MTPKRQSPATAGTVYGAGNYKSKYNLAQRREIVKSFALAALDGAGLAAVTILFLWAFSNL